MWTANVALIKVTDSPLSIHSSIGSALIIVGLIIDCRLLDAGAGRASAEFASPLQSIIPKAALQGQTFLLKMVDILLFSTFCTEVMMFLYNTSLSQPSS